MYIELNKCEKLETKYKMRILTQQHIPNNYNYTVGYWLLPLNSITTSDVAIFEKRIKKEIYKLHPTTKHFVVFEKKKEIAAYNKDKPVYHEYNCQVFGATPYKDSTDKKLIEVISTVVDIIEENVFKNNEFFKVSKTKKSFNQ